MLFVWGTTHAGKVDEVPGGMFHVVTRFGHVYYLPLIPTASFVVLEKTPGGGFRGAQIPMSLKSVLAAWLRAFCLMAMIVTSVFLAVALLDAKGDRWGWITPLIVLGAIALVLVLTYKLKIFARASYERAKRLANYAAINDVGVLALEVAYGRLTVADAEAELARQTQTEQRLEQPAVTFVE